MNSLIKNTFAAATSSGTFLLLAGAALAAVTTGYTLFGGAEYVSPGNASMRAVKLVSDNTDPFSGIDYAVTSGTTFADINTLSTDFMPESDDICQGGSPRFQIRVPETGPADSDPSGDNIFIYFGTDSGSPACVPGVWQNTTDLLDAASLVDTSQLGGTFYDTYANALAQYGSLSVSEISLVVDAGWAAADGEQTFLIDNTNIDGVIYNYEPTKEENIASCKKGGWQSYTGANGTPGPFKNQGDCVSFFATGGKNKPAGS